MVYQSFVVKSFVIRLYIFSSVILLKNGPHYRTGAGIIILHAEYAARNHSVSSADMMNPSMTANSLQVTGLSYIRCDHRKDVLLLPLSILCNTTFPLVSEIDR